jgi:hypothetical protein
MAVEEEHAHNAMVLGNAQYVRVLELFGVGQTSLVTHVLDVRESLCVLHVTEKVTFNSSYL